MTGIPIATIFPPAQAFPTLSSLFNSLIGNVMIIAGLLVFIIAAFGGFLFIVNAGKGDAKGMETGKKALTFALLGFVLIFASFWIIKIIEFATGTSILAPEGGL